MTSIDGDQVPPELRTIDDRYDVLRLIGVGGMGAVYEARHKGIGKRVAVKVLHARLIDDADAVSRFMDEARAVANIGHPNIVDCYDVGRTINGAPYIVLEYLEGLSLHDEIDKRVLSARRALRVTDQVAAGLEAVHAQQIIHRDLKSENIFLIEHQGNPDHVKILDFGVSKFLAKPEARATRRGLVIGTPDYMAPEQLTDPEGVDERIDVYALGVMLYHMLAGRLPFGPADLPTLINAICYGTPPPIDRVDIPGPVTQLMFDMLAKAPADRPGSMAIVRERIAAIAQRPSTGGSRLGHQATLPAPLGAPAEPPPVYRSVTQPQATTPAASVMPLPNPVSRRRRWPWIVGGASVVGGAALMIALGLRPSASQQVTATPGPAPVVPTPAEMIDARPATSTDARPATVRLAVVSRTSNVRVTLRGRTYREPRFDQDVASGSQPELIEVAADGHVARRYWVTLERDATLTVVLRTGKGIEDATAEETVVALGDAPDLETAHEQVSQLTARGGKQGAGDRPTGVATRGERPGSPTETVAKPALVPVPADPVPVVSSPTKTPDLPTPPKPEAPPPPAGAASGPPMPAVQPGTLDKAATQAAVRKQIGNVNECVERARMDTPSLAGKVVVVMTVAPDGRVTGSSIRSSTLGHPKSDSCIAAAVRAWRLPSPAGGVGATIAYPFSFQ